MSFLDIICDPFPFGPLSSSFLSLCFTDLLLSVLVVVLMFTIGLGWIIKMRSIHPNPKPYTRFQMFTFISSIIHFLLPIANLIYAIGSEGITTVPLFKYIEAIGVSLTWLFCLIIMELEFSRGLKTGWIVISFWVLSSTLGGFRLQTYVEEGQVETGFFYFILAEFIVSTSLSFSALIEMGSVIQGTDSLNDQPDPERVGLLNNEDSVIDYKTIVDEDIHRCSSLEEEAGIFSRMFFTWINPVLYKGSVKSLEQQDLPQLMSADDPNKQSIKFQKYWEEQVQSGRPSLVTAIWKTSKKGIIISALIKIINDVTVFAGPLLLERIVIFINDPSSPMYVGILLSFAMFLSYVVQLVSIQSHFQIIYRLGMNIESSLLLTVFKKAMIINSSALQGSSIGEIVNLQSVDAGQISSVFYFIHQIWSSPLQIIINLALIGRLVNLGAFGAVVILVLLVPCVVYLFVKIFAVEQLLMKYRDKRGTILSEMLQGIQVIKFFAWEDSFVDKIQSIREKELKKLKIFLYFNTASNAIWTAVPIFMSVSIFVIYTGLGKDLNPEIAFATLALVNNMSMPLTLFPVVLGHIIQARVSMERMVKFLLSKELDPFAVEEDILSNNAIEVNNGSFSWKDNKEILTSITFKANRSLVAVIGEVGAGKTSLINALIGELEKTAGQVKVRGSVAYVAQQAWLMNTTFKQNVLFGYPYDEKRYKMVIKLCELEADLATFPAGDLTEIGEKGINLSGGQKQRVALARAIYSDADIYLLDDPLSALDAHVGKLVFDNCICGILSEKTRILVTHQLQYLRRCDQIIYLDKGKIIEMGSFHELMSAGLDVAKLIEKHTEHKDTEDKEKGKEKKKIQNDEKKYTEEEGVLMTKEMRVKGGVSWRVYLKYVQSLGGIPVAVLIIALVAFETAADVGTNYWLSYWSDISKTVSNSTIVSFGTVWEATTQVASTAMDGELGVWFYVLVYVSIAVGAMCFTVSYIIGFSIASVRSAKFIHNSMLMRIVRAPMSFFDTVPIGRILNRFGTDQFEVDSQLPFVITQVVLTLAAIVAIIVVISSVTPLFLIMFIPLSFLYRYVFQVFRNSSRELQRLKSMARSPIYSLFSETLQGITTIRAQKQTLNMINKSDQLVLSYLRPLYTLCSSHRWLGVHLEFLGAIIIFGSCFFAVLSKSVLEPGLAGLSITYSLMISVNLNWLIRMSAETENDFVSVERCLEFTEVETEAPMLLPYRPPSNWPQRGAIQITDLVLRYRPGLPNVLNGLTCLIKPSQKIGVVGRTGAGKSSLMLAIFRIVEPQSGVILIDDEDISKIGLLDLRSRIAMIPQNPTLYTGTIRSNLDPFSNYSDAQLWEAMEAANLANQVKLMENQLNQKVTEGGNNLSVGTKQLLCLARALLKKSKILVMDEATASVDYETDLLIQAAIQKVFADATVITVAHRIHTILSYNKVMVLENGRIVEFKSPKKLLANEKSLFSALAREAGIRNNL